MINGKLDAAPLFTLQLLCPLLKSYICKSFDMTIQARYELGGDDHSKKWQSQV